MTIGSSQDWRGHTFNCDITTTATSASFHWARYRDLMIGASTWGFLPEDAGFLTVFREGQNTDLPQGGPSASWTPPPWIADLQSTAVCPWFRPLGRRMHLDDMPRYITADFGSSDGAHDLKWRVAKICDQTTAGFVTVLYGPNEPERPGVDGYIALGNSATLVMNNLAWCMRTMAEQLRQSATGQVTSFSTVPTRSSDIILAGPVFAECIRNPTVASSKVSIDRLFTNTDYLQNIQVITQHHHQGMANYAAYFRFNSTVPLDATLSFYHTWKAYIDASASRTIVGMNDESGHSMIQPTGNLFGWGATVGDYETMDVLRALRTGSMVAAHLQWAHVYWISYAHETGASDYLYNRQGAVYTNYTPYDSWAYNLELSDYRNYSTNDTPAGVISIHAKGSTDLSDLRTIAVRINTNTNPQSSYGSATPPFPEWSQSSFTEGLIRGTSGSTKYYERPIFMETTHEYTFSAEVRVTGSTLGAARLRVCGFNNLNAIDYTETTAIFGGEGWSTMTVAFSPINHGQSTWILADPTRALLQVMHNGLGTIETQNWSITTTSTLTGVSPSIREFAAPVWNAESSAIVSVPYPTVVTNDYLLLVAGTRLGPTGANITFDGIDDWTSIMDVSSSGSAPLFWVYGKRADGTETGSISLQLSSSATNSTAAAMRAMMFSVKDVRAADPAYEGVTSTGLFISNLTTSQQFEDTDVTVEGENRLSIQIVAHNSQASTFGPFNQPADAEPTAWTDAFWSSSNVLNFGVHTAENLEAAVQGGAAFEATGANVRIGGFALIGTPNAEIVASGWADMPPINAFGSGQAGYEAKKASGELGGMTIGGVGSAEYGALLSEPFPALISFGTGDCESSSTSGVGSTLFDGYSGFVVRRRGARVRAGKFTN